MYAYVEYIIACVFYIALSYEFQKQKSYKESKITAVKCFAYLWILYKKKKNTQTKETKAS